MESTDRDILSEIVIRIGGIDKRLSDWEAGQKELRTDVKQMQLQVSGLEVEQGLIRHDISWVQHTLYWGFAILGIVIALMSLRRENRKDPERISPAQMPVNIYVSEIRREKEYQG